MEFDWVSQIAPKTCQLVFSFIDDQVVRNDLVYQDHNIGVVLTWVMFNGLNCTRTSSTQFPQTVNIGHFSEKILLWHHPDDFSLYNTTNMEMLFLHREQKNLFMFHSISCKEQHRHNIYTFICSFFDQLSNFTRPGLPWASPTTVWTYGHVTTTTH